MASKKNKAYFGQSHLVAVILAIIPITNIILGVLARLAKGKIILVILNIVIFPLFWIVDLVSVILHNDLQFLI